MDFPLQPIHIAKDDVIRFKENKIISLLLDAGAIRYEHAGINAIYR